MGSTFEELAEMLAAAEKPRRRAAAGHLPGHGAHVGRRL